ncbi:MAG: heavy-metal-associated domain-containing protein [Thermodesulfovibrionales bacterium]
MNKVLNIEGMSCQHCVRRVRSALEAIKGIKAVDVSIGMASVEYDETSVNESVIIDAITKAGYKVSG